MNILGLISQLIGIKTLKLTGIFVLSEPHDLDVSFGLLIYIGLVFCFSLSKNLDFYNRQESFHDYVDLAFLK